MASQLVDSGANAVFTDVTATGAPGALNATVTATLRGQASATVQVTGIGSMTLTFEGTTDGTNFDAILGTPVAGGVPVSTTTTNGHWVNFNVAAFAVFRVRVSAYTSGTATVTVVASQGSPGQNYTTGGIVKEDLASVNGTALGTPTNFGTTPGAVVVPGVNSSIFGGTSAAGGATAAAVPAGALLSGARGMNANPTAVTNGQLVAIATDLAGRVITQPLNYRTLIGKTATTISATGATTIAAAGGASVFRDIVALIITTAGLAAQTITISDGTLSWIIDYPNAAIAPGTPCIIMFGEVPLTATTANTAWTANQSVATACHYLVQFVDRLA